MYIRTYLSIHVKSVEKDSDSMNRKNATIEKAVINVDIIVIKYYVVSSRISR